MNNNQEEKYIIIQKLINYIYDEDIHNYCRYMTFVTKHDLFLLDSETKELLDNIIRYSKYNKIFYLILHLKKFNTTYYSKYAINKLVCKLYNKYSEYTNYKLKNKESCIVCLENYSFLESCTKLCCQHTFHKSCIKNWFKNNNFTCPICRINLLEVD